MMPRALIMAGLSGQAPPHRSRWPRRWTSSLRNSPSSRMTRRASVSASVSASPWAWPSRIAPIGITPCSPAGVLHWSLHLHVDYLVTLRSVELEASPVTLDVYTGVGPTNLGRDTTAPAWCGFPSASPCLRSTRRCLRGAAPVLGVVPELKLHASGTIGVRGYFRLNSDMDVVCEAVTSRAAALKSSLLTPSFPNQFPLLRP